MSEVSAYERLEELLNDKDTEIERLRGELEDAQQNVRGAHAGWSLPVRLPAEQVLPVPRLEIVVEADEGRWYQRTSHYRLVYRHLLGHHLGVPLGVTITSGGGDEPPVRNGRVDLPIRDGAHILNEAKCLRLPAYAVCGDVVEQIANADGEPVNRRKGER